MARFLLRDGNKVGAEVSPDGLEVFTYEDQKGQLIHALATVKAEREFLRQVPSKLLPLYVRMEQALVRAVGRNWDEPQIFPRRNHRSGDRSKLVPPPLSGSGRPGALQS